MLLFKQFCEALYAVFQHVDVPVIMKMTVIVGLNTYVIY